MRWTYFEQSLRTARESTFPGCSQKDDKPRFAELATAARHENQPLNGAARSIVGASRLAAGKSGDNPRPAPDEGTGFIGCFAYFNLSRAAS